MTKRDYGAVEKGFGKLLHFGDKELTLDVQSRLETSLAVSGCMLLIFCPMLALMMAP